MNLPKVLIITCQAAQRKNGTDLESDLQGQKFSPKFYKQDIL